MQFIIEIFMALLAAVSVMAGVLIVMLAWPCRFGLHRWDHPGGHCEDCGACDEFFGPHDHDA